MLRRSHGARPASRSSRPKKRNSPAPAKSAPPPATVNIGGSVLGSIGSAIADGIGWGVGTSIGRRVIDAVTGPRVIQHKHVASAHATPAVQPNASAGPDACNVHSKAFIDCINANLSDISKCQFYLDMLTECRRGSSDRLQA